MSLVLGTVSFQVRKNVDIAMRSILVMTGASSYNQYFNLNYKKKDNIFVDIDGLKAKRVELTSLRYQLLDEMQGKPIYYYEISDWSVEKDETRVYVAGSFTYGAKVWPSSLGIAAKLCEEKNWFKGKVVLDVGCGVGLASVVCSILGAKTVIAADISPVALKLVNAAAREHKIDNIETMEFDVNSAEPLPEADVVLFGDVLYTPALGFAVARRVEEAERRGSWVVVGSMPGRHGRCAFLEEINKKRSLQSKVGFGNDCDVLPATTMADIGWRGKSVEILELNRRASSNVAAPS